jgi:hypothetical protein
MSTPQTLTSIFFEPGSTFDALRARPRFLVASLILAALMTVFTIALFQKLGFENFMRQQIENSPRTAQMTPEQKEQAISMQTSPIVKGISYASPPIFILITFAAGGALYLLGSMLMGGAISYKQALSVWVYSSFPPTILSLIANFLILFLKSADDIDPSRGGGNLVRANLGGLLGPDASPVLAAVLNSFDIFTFFGLFLGARPTQSRAPLFQLGVDSRPRPLARRHRPQNRLGVHLRQGDVARKSKSKKGKRQK